MQECTVCGLAFLSGDICPGCGSNVHQTIISEDSVEFEKDTNIPGMAEFIETSVGVIPESESDDDSLEQPTTTLPFGMGGDSVSMKSTLPFGVGSHSLAFKSKEEDLEPLVESIQEIKESYSEDEEINNDELGGLENIAPALDLEQFDEVEFKQEIQQEIIPPIEPLLVQEIDDYNLEQMPLESDVIVHDFSEGNLTTEVHVDLDNLVEYTSSEGIFNPEKMEAAAEPELHPIKALAIENLTDPMLLKDVEDGFLAMASGNWEAASHKFHRVAGSGLGGAAALNNYGLALLQKAIQTFESGDGIQKALVDGQFEAAIFALRQAAQIEGQRSEILYNLAIALHRTAFYEKSLVVFDALLERDGPSAAVLNGKAVLLESKGDFEGAKRLLNQAISNSPGDEIITSNLRRLVPM